MVKRGGRFVFLIIFSILSLVLISNFTSAACPGNIPNCGMIGTQSACLSFNAGAVCHWTTSCITNSGVTCAMVTDSCSSVGCGSGTPCTYISAESTPCCTSAGQFVASGTQCAGSSGLDSSFYGCTGTTITILGYRHFCSGNSASCTGSSDASYVTLNPSFQNCPGGCNPDLFFTDIGNPGPSNNCPCVTPMIRLPPISACNACHIPIPYNPGCCATNNHYGCYNGDVYYYSAAPCNVRGNLFKDCTALETCNSVSGNCDANCLANGAAGCTTGGVNTNCCSGLCVEGTCRADCTAYTTSVNRCSNITASLYTNYGICTNGGGCDTTGAAFVSPTYYSSCAGRADATPADTNSLAGGYSQNGVCCGAAFRTTVLATDVNNCGSCGNVCSANHGTASCSGGVCGIACSAGWLNCDGILSNGCEQSTTVAGGTLTGCSAITCDATHLNCDVNYLTNGCEQLKAVTQGTLSTCSAVTCNSNYGNCNGNVLDGCERSLTTLTDCGSCNTVCNLANVGESCATGSCAISGSCTAGYGNCNGLVPDGCEAQLNTLTNCGSCNTVCNLANVGESCATGSCAISGSCTAGYGNCNGLVPDGCEAQLNTLTNCGSCGTACALANVGESCATGSCAISGSCTAGYGNCNGLVPDGCEAQLNTLTNCGSCGTACALAHATSTCATGSCAISTCSAGWLNCDGSTANGCEQSTTVAGGTLTGCSAITCDATHLNCDVNYLTNGCEQLKAVPGGTLTGCSAITCDATHLNCDVNYLTNGCEQLKAVTGGTLTTCSAVTCSGLNGNCNSNALDGCEIALTSLTNCGSCGTACALANVGESCSTGSCVISGSCNAGYGNCDGIVSTGCETPLNTITNCAGCGTACALANVGESCATGSCAISGSCNAGYGNCNGLVPDGCEVALTSLTNCASCGTACSLGHSTSTCATGSCAISSCTSPFGNCNGVTSDGCELSLTSVSNCASCGTACSDSNVCTTESCTTGSCTHTPVSSGTACTADTNTCTSDACAANGTCMHPPIVTCTNGDGLCCGACTYLNDNDCVQCTSGNQATTCNDSNICTNDICSSGSCTNQPIANCCTNSNQCNDGDVCTADSCSGTHVCSHSIISNCCGDGTCGGGETCSTCVGDCACTGGATCQSGICARCGDRVINGFEACDDGDATGGDGCSATCTVENGYTCIGQPSICTLNCVPSCTGKLCGSDGCGANNNCGTCGANQICNATGRCVPTSICGNRTRELSETCDDGNTLGGDGCNATCRVENGYTCNLATPNVCTPVCGNGIRTAPETCDDGNLVSGDGCFANCSIQGGYVCNMATPNVCTRTQICGNGTREGTEQCDDGNLVSGDGCFANCSIQGGYVCNMATPNVCTRTQICGNGTREGTEQCDDGNLVSGDGCFANCSIQGGYVCNMATPNVCTRTQICGNGTREGTEQCDDGNLVSGDGCFANCSIQGGYVCNMATPNVCTPICGNGIRIAPETCDDGNLINGDGCNSTCRVEAGWTCNLGTPNVCALLSGQVCGNRTREGSEQCDDGNLNNNDGCSSTCNLESGWTCNAAVPNVCTIVCGNGIRTAPETCDDGNLINGDGCNSTCRVENGWNCNLATPNVCTPISAQICGNRTREGTEQCDDGNTNPNDGCSATCTVEAGWTCNLAVPNVCTPLASCGNNIREGSEECDGIDLNGETCTSRLGSAYTGVLGCSGCTFDTTGCYLSCDLTDAYWGDTMGLAEETAKLYVEGTNCDGKTINFAIWEDDGIFSDDSVSNNPAPLVSYSSSNNYGVWTIEWMEDNDHIGQNNPPEYYFVASVDGESESITSSRSEELKLIGAAEIAAMCQGKSYCSEYTELGMTFCNHDFCHVGTNNVPETITCGEVFNPATGCYDSTDCGCGWDNELSICESDWDFSYNCTGETSSVGTCNYIDNTENGCNGNEGGTISRHLDAVWTWSVSNPFHLDPSLMESKCSTIDDVILCSASAQVSFFGTYQIIIIVAIVGLVYLIYVIKRKNNSGHIKKHSKIKVKKRK